MTKTRRRTATGSAGLARLRGALQTARRARGWDDATYYGRLGSVVGRRVASTTELSTDEAARCLDDINGNRRHDATRWQGSLAPLLRHIEDLLGRVRGADGEPVTGRYAEAILFRQRGLPDGTPCPLGMASAQELRGVIAALYKWLGAPRARA